MVIKVTEQQLKEVAVDTVNEEVRKKKKKDGSIDAKFFPGAITCGGLGYTAFPNILLAYQSNLTFQKNGRDVPLEPLDVNILIHLLGFYQYKNHLVRITHKTLSDRIAKSPRQIARSLKRLVENGYIEKHRDVFEADRSFVVVNRTLSYSLNPFIEKLEFLYKKHVVKSVRFEVLEDEEESNLIDDEN